MPGTILRGNATYLNFNEEEIEVNFQAKGTL